MRWSEASNPGSHPILVCLQDRIYVGRRSSWHANSRRRRPTLPDADASLDISAVDGPVVDVPMVDVVVPVFNEERALEAGIRRLHAYLSGDFPFSWRITIVDNASTDGRGRSPTGSAGSCRSPGRSPRPQGSGPGPALGLERERRDRRRLYGCRSLDGSRRAPPPGRAARVGPLRRRDRFAALAGIARRPPPEA